MDNLQPGQMLGPYRLINQIGQGGMATVYKAYHAAMDRYVALKVLPRQLAENPEFLGRFQQEARIIANLEHPHILPVHDYGENDNITYLVMRLLEAGTLKDKMRAHPLTLPEIDRYFSQLADALEYAHAHGVIHRDLKPSNVLVDARGNLFLTDFGIAKLLESSSQFTDTGALIGTPDYMSPEQAQGLKVDPRTDIYSLGIILYEMVTGRVPFEAETPLAVILQHVNAPLPLPTTLQPGLSPAIERVLLKALAKAPDDRFATTDAFHESWKKALAEAVALPADTAPAASVLPPVPEPATSAAPAALPPVVPDAPPARPVGPARRKLPVWALAGSAVLGCLLVACCAFALWRVMPRLLAGAKNTPGPTPAESVAAAPTVETPVAAAPGPAAQWTSWVGANHLWAVVESGDEIVAGGRGLTLWNRSTGALARQFIGPADGLPYVLVNALLVGDGGALWVGTGAGVGFFSDAHWSYYTEADGLDSGQVSALAWAKAGLLAGTQYCGSEGCGLNLFTTDGIQPVAGFPSTMDEQPEKLSHNVTALLTTDKEMWWVGTMNGLARFDGQQWTLYFTTDGLPDNNVTSLFQDQEEGVWVGTSQGMAKFNGTRFEPVAPLQGMTVMGMVQDTDGRYWFSGSGGLARFDPATSDWQHYTQEADNLPSYDYYGAARDADGNLYFGSDGGLVRYDGEKFATWAVPNVPAHGYFGKILPAPEGDALWFVEQWGGSQPDRFDPLAGTWSTVGGLPEACNPLALDADKAVWCGGTEGLWILHADGRQTHLTTADGLPSDRVFVVAFPASAKGSAWVGTEDKGVALFDGEKITQVFDAANGALSGDSVHALLAASDGSLWVGNDKGLDRYGLDGAWEHYTAGQPFGESDAFYVTDIAESADGAIWVSTDGECACVHRFAEGQWQLFASGDPGVKLPNTSIFALTATPAGAVWFGSYYHGAARFDGKTWTSFQVEDGLIHPDITDIYVDPAGAVWFASPGGATRYIP